MRDAIARERPQPRRIRRLAVGAILALYLLIGLTHSVVNPVFESSDEWSHYPFVEYVARGQGLPVQKVGAEMLWRHEGSQPPLYYLMMGALTSWIDARDLPQIMAPNPHARIGIPLAPDNKNMIVHTAAENWPWRGAVLAVHLVRIASVLMAAITLLFTYLIARELVPDEPGVPLLAMALHAFLPMFAFISASVNNDNLTYMLSAIGLYLILRAARGPLTTGGLLRLGVVLGLVALTKLSGLVLLPVAALAVLIGHLRQEKPGFSRETRFLRGWLRDLLIIAVPVVLIAAWWYVRNVVLYGDPTGLAVLNTFIRGRDGTPWYQLLWGEWETFRISFWGLFGGVNVLMQPLWIYHVLDGIALAAVIGLVAWVIGRLRRKQPTRWVELGLAVLYVLLLLIGVARYTLSTPATQGRLIFPGLAAVMTLFALGLIGWVRPAWRPAVGAPVAVLLFALALSSPFTAIRDAYALPKVLAADDLPETARNFRAMFGDPATGDPAPRGEIELLGYDFGKRRLHPGEELPVTLYWQALRPPAENYSLYLKVFGPNDEVLGQIDVYPGRGTLPTAMWQPGRVVVDTFYVPITRIPAAPVAADVRAGLYRLKTLTNLEARDPRGQVVKTPVLGQVKVYGPQAEGQPATPTNVKFGGLATLLGYDLSGPQQPGRTVTLTLHWQATGAPDRNYTVFVHLLDAGGGQVANFDGPPMEGAYPTAYWEPGERLLDQHAIALPPDWPPGAHRAVIGLYDPVSGARLSALAADGQALPDNALTIEINVAAP